MSSTLEGVELTKKAKIIESSHDKENTRQKDNRNTTNQTQKHEEQTKNRKSTKRGKTVKQTGGGQRKTIKKSHNNKTISQITIQELNKRTADEKNHTNIVKTTKTNKCIRQIRN